MADVWTKLEGYLDTAVDAAAEGYVNSRTPPTSGTTQPLPEQTVTTVPNRTSDRTKDQADAVSKTVDWLKPYQKYLPFAAIALVVALVWSVGRRS